VLVRKRFFQALTGLAAVLVLAGCTAPSVRLATSAETQQATQSGSTPKPATGAQAAPATPAPQQPSAPAPTPSGSGALSQFQAALQQLAAKVQPSVVEIETSAGIGSGIIFDTSGDIVTNAHVMDTATTAKVVTSDGNQYTADLVGSYPGNDFAVIRVPAADGLAPATFGDSSKVAVGDIVLAIGSPFGLADSVTEGIVSATGRAQSEGNGVTLTDLIQTSAGINPGNSGGALVNISGQVIGIPTLSGSDRQQAGQPSENVGFAIPSNQVISIANQLIAHGSVTHTNRAYMGVTTRDSAAGGVDVVSTVSGGPAAKAGIQAGWIITDLGGHAVTDANSLTQLLSAYKPGDAVKVGVRLPDGSSRTVTVQLGERPVTTP
jgi:putative serine protease PepD